MLDADGDLTEPGGKLRLFVDMPLKDAARITPTEGQAHYLLRVMRAKTDDVVLLFNGRDGEWRARIVPEGKRSCVLHCESQRRAMSSAPDLWLVFAPIKKTPADYVAQKATELGVSLLQPVITHRTVARRVNTERLRANAVEAAEQSDRLDVPETREPTNLDALLRTWPQQRHLIFCDEGGAPPIAQTLRAHTRVGPWAVLTGPEGGFDDGERALIRSYEFVMPVSLGPRILRADTAALAALAVWGALQDEAGS